MTSLGTTSRNANRKGIKNSLLYDPAAVKKEIEATKGIQTYLTHIRKVDEAIHTLRKERAHHGQKMRGAEHKIYKQMETRGRLLGHLSVIRATLYNQIAAKHIRAKRDELFNADNPR